MSISDYNHTLLFVDDELNILNSLKRLFRKENYQILTASSGQEGLELLKKTDESISLIISDQRMPEMNGAQFLEKAKEIFPDAIRFLLTGYSDIDAIVNAINKGEIHRYLAKPWNDNDLILQVRQAIEQYELVLENRRLLSLSQKQNKELNELNRNLEKKVNERTLEIKEKNEELRGVNIKLEKSFGETIRLLSSLIGTLNPTLGKYMVHVAELAKEVAGEYLLEEKEVNQIEMAGMIHDIGLLGLSEKIWTKNEKYMNETEFKMYSQHPVIASIALESVKSLDQVGEIILYHHEYFDGSGFPNGLKGEKIPLGSRIVGTVSDYCKIVDTWPKEVNQIVDRAKKYLGETATNELDIAEPEEMIENIAEKFISLKINEKYDNDIVVKLMEKVKKEKRISSVTIEGLKERMVLAMDLRIKDGRLLLVKGAELKENSIKTIKKLAEAQLIEGKISILL